VDRDHPPDRARHRLSGTLVGLGLGLAWFHLAYERRGANTERLARAFKLASIPPTVVGAFILVARSQLPAAELHWIPSEVEGRRIAQTEHQPMIIDFGAAWCAACNELRTRTFADAAVRSEASRFVAVSVDATDDDNRETADAKTKYGVVGLPTVVLLDSSGRERKRFAEFVPPQQFLVALQSIDGPAPLEEAR
jgi:thiol:disulfide interchange protein DsbD